MRVLITGGGTGGHLYPALAVAEILKKKDPTGELLFVGTKEGLESWVVPAQGYPFWEISAAKWPRKFSEFFPFLISLGRGYRMGLKIIKEFCPQVVFATGGYVSVPLVLAAARLKVPIFLHEQNSVPGLANIFLARLARSVFTTFPLRSKIRGTKVIHTGLPIREEILKVDHSAGLHYFRLNSTLLTLLVIGGSQGSKKINEVMLEIYELITKEKVALPLLQIIHLTGRDQYAIFCRYVEQKGILEDKIGKLIIKPYLEKIEYALAAADLVISRAGAATLAEVTAKGLPAILIPYPYAAGNHQYYNALFFAQKKAVVLILEKDLTPQVLLDEIEKLIQDPLLRITMGQQARSLARPYAGEVIARTLLKVK